MSKLELLTPANCTLMLIDHQPQMVFGVQSVDRTLMVNNVVGLAKAAKIFGVPTILTTITAAEFSGHLLPEIQAVFPGQATLDRTTMNPWEDRHVVAAVERAGRKKLVMAGLWTEVCLAFPAIEAVRDGYEVYAVLDASGGVTTAAHDAAVQRMVQAGVVPTTWLQFALELQRDWARGETAMAVGDLAIAHGGTYGVGIGYYRGIANHTDAVG
jgi:nicotinamidase-related amidase